jgi:hypothetical protein
MRYRFAWDEFSVLLHLWACKNRECSERPTLHRPTFEISDGGGVCSFFYILELWYVILSFDGLTLLSTLYLPTTTPWAFFYFPLVYGSCSSCRGPWSSSLHCTTLYQYIRFFLDYRVCTKYSWSTLFVILDASRFCSVSSVISSEPCKMV